MERELIFVVRDGHSVTCSSVGLWYSMLMFFVIRPNYKYDGKHLIVYIKQRLARITMSYDISETAGDFILEPLGTPRSQQVETTLLVELRKHPRFDTRLHAEIIVENGSRANGIITNISQSGLRLEGGRHLMDAIVPGHKFISQHSPVSLEAQFSLPGGMDQASEVTVRCNTVYVQSETEDTYQIGIVFTGFNAGEKALMKYLASRETRR